MPSMPSHSHPSVSHPSHPIPSPLSSQVHAAAGCAERAGEADHDERDTLLNKIEGIASSAADDKRKAMERLKQKLKEKQQKLAVTESKVKDLQKWSRLRNASEAKIRTATDNLQVRKR